MYVYLIETKAVQSSEFSALLIKFTMLMLLKVVGPNKQTNKHTPIHVYNAVTLVQAHPNFII